MKRIGWIVDSSPAGVYKWPWQRLSIVAEIRYGLIAKHLNRQGELQMELYQPFRHYDAVVFVKMMNPACLSLAKTLKKKKTKIIFDTNVNYFEIWGDYVIPGTRPTENQQKEARDMTAFADHVVADSSYLAGVCAKLNANVTWIPDAVDTAFFSPGPAAIAAKGSKLRLIWSGISKKAYHLELIEPVLRELQDRVEITLVTDREAPHNPRAAVISRLAENLGAQVHLYSPESFRDLLRTHEVIISPKILNNAYEAAHTEYKITLGMAAALPALASPQTSYIDAIGDGVGGSICKTEDDWKKQLLHFLENPEARLEAGRRARQRVIDRYSVAAVAPHYQKVLKEMLWA